MKNRGQVLVLLLILLPVLLLTFGIFSRVGGLTLAHDQIENHCNKKVLDALSAQARALEELGWLNPKSRVVIRARRIVDNLIETGVANYYMPYLIPLDRALRALQHVISVTQKTIKSNGTIAALTILNSATPKKMKGKIGETYHPFIPSYYLKEDEGFKNETGAPLEPSDEFEKKQIVEGIIHIFSEKFLWSWADFTKNDFQGKLKSKDMTLICKAKINMSRLEDPWTVQLTPVAKR